MQPLSLREKLAGRYERLAGSNTFAAANEVRLLAAFPESQPSLRAVLADAAEPGLDADGFLGHLTQLGAGIH